MRIIGIKDKLQELGLAINDIVLGDYDLIGRFTAERTRDRNSELFKTSGLFYRANYERGILISQLIKKYEIQSILEIGFGRGYSTFCAAKTFSDLGIKGRICSVDPNFDQNHLALLQKVFPQEWFKHVELVQGTSQQAIPEIKEDFDLIYIDGDHSFEGTKLDWEMTKNKWKKCLLFDDYHLPSKIDPGIQCRELIDTIDDPSKELIIMDRRIFTDDRKLSDEQINYGQVLLTKHGLNNG